MQNARFLTHSQHYKWDAWQQGETSIATWVFHNLQLMYKGALDSIYMSLMVNIMSFLPPTTLKLHVNYQILGTPSQHRKLDAVLYEETLIATWVFQNLPWMHKDGGRSVCQHMQTIYGFRSVISAKKDHSMFMQNIRFWALYQHSKLDDVLQEETHIATWAFHNHPY